MKSKIGKDLLSVLKYNNVMYKKFGIETLKNITFIEGLQLLVKELQEIDNDKQK